MDLFLEDRSATGTMVSPAFLTPSSVLATVNIAIEQERVAWLHSVTAIIQQGKRSFPMLYDSRLNM